MKIRMHHTLKFVGLFSILILTSACGILSSTIEEEDNENTSVDEQEDQETTEDEPVAVEPATEEEDVEPEEEQTDSPEAIEVTSSEDDLEEDVITLLESQIVDPDNPQNMREHPYYLSAVFTAMEVRTTVDVHYNRYMDNVPYQIRNLERAEFSTPEMTYYADEFLLAMELHTEAVESLDGNFDEIHNDTAQDVEEAFVEQVVAGNEHLANAYEQLILIADEYDLVDLRELRDLEDFIEDTQTL
ncbi:hypothetical protein JCM19037_1435 [Geomicrobium sp. JCM 19037]|uniref:hypothetical protein n=1 Tax=unclassified Geomicrobium TaxID=2628951 RepID=UPI00045F480E|nr:hypothetical protein [Geomicrobium sp. JCM 19037]GAK03140.1 hypothetical protein JCM19037_1435 [Geomicrobium sp. JCM 19037]